MFTGKEKYVAWRGQKLVQTNLISAMCIFDNDCEDNIGI